MAETKAKPIVKKAAAPKTTAAKKLASPMKITRAKKGMNAIGDKQRYEMIQNAAYFIAERNGFAGDSQAFWAEAEAQIDGMLPR